MTGKGPPDDPTGEERRKKFRVVRPDEAAKPSSSAKPSPESIRQIYMASPHIEWTPFAKSMNWSPKDSRDGLPIVDWISEKKEIFAREQSEMIADAVFSHQSRWHHDVLKTLKEYPEANDAMLGILKKRLNDIIQDINEDEMDRMKALQNGNHKVKRRFRAIQSRELASLSAAIKICTESKHKSLMINDWSFKIAEQYSDPKQFAVDTEKMMNQEWKVMIKGAESQSSKELQQFVTQWYDKPPLPHTQEEIEESREKE